MKEVVLITGASGTLATYVSEFLSNEYEVRLLTTNKKICDNKKFFYWNIDNLTLDPACFNNLSYIIHLAGYSILKNWSTKNKKIMYSSRVKSTELLFSFCKKNNVNLKAFICASAMGIYKPTNLKIDEKSEKCDSWLGQMAVDWEKSSDLFKELNARVIQLRIPLILSRNGGFLKYNILSMRFRLGVILGNSKSRFNWIYIEDIARFIKFSLTKNSCHGAYNVTVGQKCTNYQFYKVARKIMFPFLLIFIIPSYFIRKIIGPRSQILLTNYNLDNSKLIKTGFNLKFNTVESLFQYLKKS